MCAVIFNRAIRNDETVARARELRFYSIESATPVMDGQRNGFSHDKAQNAVRR